MRPLSEIKVPCFLIGGMLDGYRDSIPAMLEQTKAPIRAIVGPWNHTFPNDASPGPQVEWRDQAVRWWDYWLKGQDTGVLQDPKLVIYMRHWFPPDPSLETVPGEWRGEPSWPPPEVKNTTFFLDGNHGLSPSPAVTTTHQLKYVPSIGVEAGFWWGELLNDVRPVDAFSLVYDSAPLEEDLAILGRPTAWLRASASAPLADWFVRLSDVAPDGRVTQITGAGLSGAQRDSMTDPEELQPGKIYPLNVQLHLTSWVFPKGHRIRVAISNALWPMVLPTPFAMTTSLELGGAEGSRVVLPIVPLKGTSATPFAKPEPSGERNDIHSSGELWPGEWSTTRDHVNHKSTVHWQGQTTEEYRWGKETDYESLDYTANDEHPETSEVRGEAKTVFELKGRTLTWQGRLAVSTDQKNFYYRYTRELLKDGRMLKTKSWEETVSRDHQ